MAEKARLSSNQVSLGKWSLSQAVHTSPSPLLISFDKDERGPDDALKLQFEAVSGFDPESKEVVQQVLDRMILQQEARRWSSER